LSLASTSTTPHNVLSVPTINLGQYDVFTFALWIYPTATNLLSKNTAIFDFSSSTTVNTARIILCNQANNKINLHFQNSFEKEMSRCKQSEVQFYVVIQ
jgi:hypothetical protein